MHEVLSNLYHFFGVVAEFFVGTILIKIILAHWLADRVMAGMQRFIGRSERRKAIWTHYQHRALGIGHGPKDVLDCTDGKCPSL